MFEYAEHGDEIRVYSPEKDSWGEKHFIQCRVVNLINDCSSMSLGAVYYNNCPSVTEQERLAKVLIHFLFRQYRIMKYNRNYCWKVVLTNEFKDGNKARFVQQSLEHIANETIVNEVRGWQGDRFYFTLLEIEKTVDYQGELNCSDIDFSGYDAEVNGEHYYIEEYDADNVELDL